MWILLSGRELDSSCALWNGPYSTLSCHHMQQATKHFIIYTFSEWLKDSSIMHSAKGEDQEHD